MDLIKTDLSNLLVQLVLALIGLLAAYATAYFAKLKEKAKAETAKIKDDGERQLFNNALDDVEKLTTVTVNSIEQTTAKDLREAIKAGTGNRNELLDLAKKAAFEITTGITPEAKQLITANLGSFEDYVAKLIEDKVLALKTT